MIAGPARWLTRSDRFDWRTVLMSGQVTQTRSPERCPLDGAGGRQEWSARYCSTSWRGAIANQPSSMVSRSARFVMTSSRINTAA